ncbi:MAG TPA: polysaccharide biosynthesis tyrosine autokinase [Steroidobacteraceae bacterium]
MNATPDNLTSSVDKSLVDELISLWALSTDSVERIAAVVRSEGLSFGEAAVRLGLVTMDDLHDANAWIGRRGAHPSTIEAAIQQAKTRNSVALRHAGTARPSSQLLLVYDPDSERSERIRALRTELMLLIGEARQDNVLAVLSPNAAEGRSQLCAELAISFAQSGRRTLLVDADMRHPHQQVLFSADYQWGLAQALSLGEVPPLYGVEGVPDLSLLTAGIIPPNPLELVTNRRFARMVDSWRRSYDFVLIDTPPVSQFADGLAIATAATRVLVVTRTESTSFSSMKDLARRLGPTQARIMGAVLNKF